MAQVKKLEGMLKKLEVARDKLKKESEGGFIGIGHQIRDTQRGGAYLGSKADYFETNVRGNPIAGGILSGGRREKFYVDNTKGGNFANPGVFSGGRGSGGGKGRGRPPKSAYMASPPDMSMVGHGVRSGGVRSGGVRSGGKKSDGRAKAAKGNSWLIHVKAYAKKHNIPYQLAISEARPSYKPK